VAAHRRPARDAPGGVHPAPTRIAQPVELPPIEHVTFHVWRGQSLPYAALFYEGLQRFSRRTGVRMRTAPWPSELGAPPSPAALLTVQTEGRRVRALLETHDKEELWWNVGLGPDDLYVKRAFPRAGVPAEATDGCRYAPMAPILVALSPAARVRLGADYARHGARTDWRDLVNAARSLYGLSAFDAFERQPGERKDGRVLLQTRLWGDDEVRGEDTAAAVNAERIALTRALKTTFGERFVGGIVPTATGRELAPDLVVPTSVRSGHYARLVRAASVGIYVRGLHHSTAFKLAEYLASGCAVVGHELRNRFATPFEPGTHYASFDTVERCVAHCDELLTRPERQREIAEAGHAYYLADVAPEAQLRRALAQLTGRRPL
jgi:hypothetical protein